MKFTDIPADQWEKDFFADELKEDRKADRPARNKASNNAAAFNALMQVSGLSPDVHRTAYIFLDKTKGKAPDEAVKFSETEAGRLLPGDAGVSGGSSRRRWNRAWDAFNLEMARTGKSLGRREKGSIILGARGTEGKKQSPTYYSEIAQAVVDIERAALRMRSLKRDERFKQAAQVVWSNLPAAIAPEEKTKPKAAPSPRVKRLAGNDTRRMERFLRSAGEMVEAAKEDGQGEQMAARLVVEFGKLAASSLGVENESLFLLLADALQSAAENEPAIPTDQDEARATNFFENPQIPEQNDVSQGFTVDTAVHVEDSEGAGAQDFPDYQIWLKDNQERVSLWCSNDTETWEMYEAEKALAVEGRTVDDLLSDIPENQKPTAFRMAEKKPKGDVIYAEEFTV